VSSERKQQHPLVIFLRSFEYAKFVVLYVGGWCVAQRFFGGSSEVKGLGLYPLIVGAGLIIISLVRSFVHWATFSFQQREDGSLNIWDGLLVRRYRVFTKEKVQSVELQATFMQRVFRFVGLKVHTASGGKEPEFSLPLLPFHEAEEIRLKLCIHIDELGLQNEPKAGLESIVFSLSILDLMWSGLTRLTFRGTIFLLLIAHEVIPEKFHVKIASALLDSYESSTATIAFVITLLTIAFSWGISTATEMVRYYGFSIVKREREVIIRYGLFNKKTFQFRFNRIQFVSVAQNPVRRSLEVGEVSAHIATSQAGFTGDQIIVLAPRIPISKVNDLLRVLNFTPLLPDNLRVLSRNGLLPHLLHATVKVVGAIAIVGILLVPVWQTVSRLFNDPIIVTAVILLVIFTGRISWKNSGFLFEEEFVVIRRGIWKLETLLLPKRKVVATATKQFITQRKRKLCTVQFLSAGQQEAVSLIGADEAVGREAFAWLRSGGSTELF